MTIGSDVCYFVTWQRHLDLDLTAAFCCDLVAVIFLAWQRRFCFLFFVVFTWQRLSMFLQMSCFVLLGSTVFDLATVFVCNSFNSMFTMAKTVAMLVWTYQLCLLCLFIEQLLPCALAAALSSLDSAAAFVFFRKGGEYRVKGCNVGAGRTVYYVGDTPLLCRDALARSKGAGPLAGGPPASGPPASGPRTDGSPGRFCLLLLASAYSSSWLLCSNVRCPS